MTLSRRRLVASTGLVAAAGLAAASSREGGLVRPLLDAADGFTYRAQRLLLPGQALAREFPRSMISRHFPAINMVHPVDEAYHRAAAAGFADWRLPVDGLVARPASYSLAELRRFPARTQVTQHNCVDGWSAIGEWTGVPLARLLAHAGLRPEARYVAFSTVDGFDGSLDLADALHPQTILAYGMNGQDLPMRHGAPLRLRVERQLGYKNLKFITAITAVAEADTSGQAYGGYQWYAGI